ncbi:unnamed protein product [Ascophyllum nodosum]
MAQQQQQHKLTPPTINRSCSGRGVRRGATWREANANGPPRRMEVSIPQKNLKVFACAVQCLMKIGKELFIETTADQLVLRTLNDAKSAFSAFYFNNSGGFFETFRCSDSRPSQGATGEQAGLDSQDSAAGGDGGSVSCKVLVRAVHNILRTLKKVVRLVIYVEGEDDSHIEPHLVFQMYCEFGYRKVHRFSLQDCEIMHAVFEGEGASRLACPPVQISQLLEHIHGTAEVAVGASHDVLTVRSYHHPLTGAAERAVLKTEMSISTAEFDTYRFCGEDDEEVELVFSLKEIKALLHFTEATEAQTLEMLFREGGDPLLFQSHSKTFAAELIMATMEPKIIRKETAAAPPPPADGRKADPDPTEENNQAGGGDSGQRGQEMDAESAAQGEWEGGHGGAPGQRRREALQVGGREEEEEEEEDDLYHRRGHSAQAGVRVGPAGPARAQASRDQQCFENDPFGEAMTGGRGSEPPSSSAEYERRSDPRRQPPYRDGRRRIYDDEGMGYDNNDDSGHGGYGGGFQGEEAGSWNAGASAESHPDGDGDATGEPQSEMPTQFPGVRAAYDTAGDGFDVRMQGGWTTEGEAWVLIVIGGGMKMTTRGPFMVGNGGEGWLKKRSINSCLERLARLWSRPHGVGACGAVRERVASRKIISCS